MQDPENKSISKLEECLYSDPLEGLEILLPFSGDYDLHINRYKHYI